MKIIGINAWHADASASLIVDGKLILAIEEERFTRQKHWAGFPVRAITFCLNEAGLDFQDIDFFSIGRDPKAKLAKKLRYLAKHPGGSFSAIRDRLSNSRKVRSVAEELANASGLPVSFFDRKIQHVEHHRSHLASAYFASPFTEAACFSVDGSGDFTTTMFAHAAGNQINVLHSVDFPHSLGILYSAFTQLLGFPHYGDEYKVMGMAPYGKPAYKEAVGKLMLRAADGRFKLNTSFFRKGTDGIISYDEHFRPVVACLFSPEMESLFGPARRAGEPLSQHHKDLAASVQAATEEMLFEMLNALHRQTNCDNLCLAGGVAQNSVANGKITLHTPFRNIYIPSAGHDAGISMGAALFTYYHKKPDGPRHHIRSAYLGSRFSNDQIREYLQTQQLAFEEKEDVALFDLITDILMEGGVVGWFTGRAEFGPRALGGRSILADPRRSDAKELINSKIKRRESFRPFAPSVLREYAGDYFEQNDEAPFMEKVFAIQEGRRTEIPAVTHVDGTGRLQTVDKEISPRYYALIDTFRRKTGVPILLNTSFNENEPIVNTPGEAVDCFLRTDMDMLVLENLVLRKRSNPAKWSENHHS